VKLPSTKENPALVVALVRRAVIITVCLAIALVVAYWIGSGQTFYLKIAAGFTLVILVVAGMQQNAWILIPIAWTLVGASLMLPFHFSFHDLAILLAVSAYVMFRVLTHKDVQRRLNFLDILLALIVLNTVVDYVRHPVGFLIFGSEMIGGRFFINIGLALSAYWVIRRLPESVKMASYIPYFILAGTLVAAVFQAIVHFAPSTTPFVYMVYAGVDYSEYVQSVVTTKDVVRISGTRDFGLTLILILCSLYPTKTLFNPLRIRFWLLGLGFLMVMVAGFRSTLLGAVAVLAIAALIQQGWRGLAITILAGSLLLAAVIFGHGRLYDLPTGIQRSLSFLPGRWDPIVLADAEESSSSRFEWWLRVIKEDVIKDWWFGDGIGVTEKEMQNVNSKTTFFDWFTATGGFHNGPLTTIRYAGVIGLVLFYTFMITAAVYSVKCVRMCRGTPLEMAAIFLALQLIWFPLEFTFIFGAYDLELPNEIFLVSLLLLLMRLSDSTRAKPSVPKPAQFAIPTAAMA